MSRPASLKVRIGILGAGTVVKEFHLPVLRNIENAEIVWLCDKVESQARNLSRLFAPAASVFTRIEDCTDVDIVLVAIPVGFRREPLKHIFSRGWHVLCEKPFAVSLAQHDEFLDQAAESRVQIGVGLMRRYYCGTLLAKRLIQSRVLGEVSEVWASQGARLTRTGRRDWYQGDSAAAGGGILMETGSHLVDQLFSVLNVQDFNIATCKQRIHAGIDLETKATGMVTTTGGESIPFTLALSNIRDLHNGIAIRFSQGVLKLGVSVEVPTLWTVSDQLLANLETDDGAKRVPQAFYLEWQDFIRQCQSPSGYRSAINAQTARCSTAFIDCCYKMAAERELPMEAVAQ